MTTKVSLTLLEALLATQNATLQLHNKVYEDRDNDHGGHSVRSLMRRFADGIHGQFGEVASAKTRNQYWMVGGKKVSRGDLNGKDEVRATPYPAGHLLIYQTDLDDALFILAVGNYPEFEIFRPIQAGLCKRPEFWRQDWDPPCYGVPQKFIREKTGDL